MTHLTKTSPSVIMMRANSITSAASRPPMPVDSCCSINKLSSGGLVSCNVRTQSTWFASLSSRMVLARYTKNDAEYMIVRKTR